MFFRQGTDTGKRAAARVGGTTEAQLKELRGKARRRLIGALALVLAAFIVVPWLFDDPVPDDTHAPVVVPAVPAGLPPLAAATPPVDAIAPSSADTPVADVSASGGVPPTDTQGAVAADVSGNRAQHAETTAPVVAIPPIQPPAPPPVVVKPPKEPAAKPGAQLKERTDDGSVALALLAGKLPAGGTPTAGQGRYYLQVAAYAGEQDAYSRRDGLRQAGVTDAYVEKGQSGGRIVYRLRVGPFGSHEAAQAAQTRLRALGYENGLISDK